MIKSPEQRNLEIFVDEYAHKKIDMRVLQKFKSKFGQDAKIEFKFDKDEFDENLGIRTVVFSVGARSCEVLHPSRPRL